MSKKAICLISGNAYLCQKPEIFRKSTVFFPRKQEIAVKFSLVPTFLMIIFNFQFSLSYFPHPQTFIIAQFSPPTHLCIPYRFLLSSFSVSLCLHSDSTLPPFYLLTKLDDPSLFVLSRMGTSSSLVRRNKGDT